MKFSRLLVAAASLTAAALLVTACDDAKHVQPNGVNVQSLQTEAQDVQVKLFKMEYDEANECQKYTEVRTIEPSEAKALKLQSAMALCEERLKPIENSKVSGATDEEGELKEVETEDGEVAIDYSTPEARFVCFRTHEVKQNKKATGACEG